MTPQADDRDPTWRRYLRFWRRDPHRDVDEEVRFHMDSLIEELVAAGWTRESAEREAARRFGDPQTVTRTLQAMSLDQERSMRRVEWLDALSRDLRHGVRQLIKAPAFTAVAVLTLALGIGANSAIFSVVYSVLLHPLPFEYSDRTIAIWELNGSNRMSVTYGNFGVWRTQATAFEAIGARRYSLPLTLTGFGDPSPIATQRASAGFWKALRIPPVLGAYYDDESDRLGAEPVVVLSQALWTNKFGADRTIVGKQLMLGGRAYRVVAVAPADYRMLGPAEMLWAPLAPTAEQLADHTDHELSAFGLLKPGQTAASALAQLNAIQERIGKDITNPYFARSVELLPMLENFVGDSRVLLFALMGAVGLVLLIACANVANLLIARAAVRRQEIAIRGALGATRSRIVFQLLVESLLLSLTSAAIGVAIAFAGIRFLVTSPLSISRLSGATLNGPVLAFTAGLAVTCAVLFGLLPALWIARQDLQQVLRDGGREARASVRERFRGALIVAELSLAQVLLVGAGLLIRSATLVNQVPPGFDTQNLLIASVNLPAARYANDDAVNAGYSRIDEAIASLPGVTAVARTQVAPIYSGGWNWTAFREGSSGVVNEDGAVVSDMRAVGAGYFATIGARLVAGREFTANDRKGAPAVAVISRGLAKSVFGDVNVLGKRISNGSLANPDWMEIVGVAEDIRANGLARESPRMLYRPAAQWVNGGQTLLVRGTAPVTALVPAIRRAVASVDPLLAVSGVNTMEAAVARQQALPRFTAWLLALLGATGLILAVVGVYGVVSYSVTQRAHEFGVRMALGAGASSVRWMVVRQSLVFGVIGVAIGTATSMLASRMIQGLLYQVTVRDPFTHVGVGVTLLIVGAAAGYLPARRATRIDPLAALRGS